MSISEQFISLIVLKKHNDVFAFTIIYLHSDGTVFQVCFHGTQGLVIINTMVADGLTAQEAIP